MEWCAITWDGRFITSYDNGATWGVESLSGASPGDVTGTQAEWYSVVYGFGRYWAICRGDGAGTSSDGIGGNSATNNSRIVFSRDGKTWYKADAALGTICGTFNWFRGLGFNGTRFVSASEDGYFAYGDCDAKIRFTNITSTSDQCTQANTDYKITEKKEFFIEPSQISDTKTDGEYTIDMDLTNVRLISAEITNRPYERNNEHYVPEESDATHSLQTTYVHVSTKRPLKVKFKKYDHMECELHPINGATMPKIIPNNAPGKSGNISLKSGDAAIKIHHNETSTITYSSDCFADCPSGNKASISLTRGYVEGLTLRNQKIRFWFGKSYYDKYTRTRGKLTTIWNGQSSSSLE